MSTQKQPWVKFYTTDWRSDPCLKMCSLAARGLWIEMISLMHEATPYGHLLVSGQCPTDTQLAVLVGAPPDQIAALLGELESARVFSRTREGVIYSRKLSRMAKKAATARNNGRKGGNPSLGKGGKNPPPVNPQDKGGDKPQRPEARDQIKKEEPYGSLSPRGNEATKPFDEVAEAVVAYNRTAEDAGWPRLLVLSKQRRANLKARLKDAGGLNGWEAALARARASPWCCGENQRGWTANFDFLTRQSSFAKLMEGNYDPRTASTAQPRTANGRGMAGSATASEIADRGARWAASRKARG
ncbi:hypothetical protein [Roseinatronobacter alkalisoli]|uniref:Helix-turn-helix domain-containing protein n=1 Tax=Roseinatronobacter alkalisoli TaxID=3028235 RepID=A0ABT5TEJ9_9RHOB|nr:hypothetical protein [Roseinatronobacter sp. HJB301]MDD7973431.1 hypothetical protein [Roseinatronobacter sp. HJB301]